MILAAHQPLYLPPVSFFKKLLQSDVFVLADNLQFSTNSMVNKSRILTIKGAEWLTVPVLSRGYRNQPICDVIIDNSQNWRRKHLRSLEVNYRYAPYFEFYFSSLGEIIGSDQYQSLSELNLDLIKFISGSLRLTTRLIKMSELNTDKSNLVVSLAKETGCDTYMITSVDYRKETDAQKLRQNGINLKEIDPLTKPYPTQFPPVDMELSVIDLLFNRGPESVLYLQD